MKNKKLQKAQSIMEYLLVATVFAIVGVGTFIAANLAAARARQAAQEATTIITPEQQEPNQEVPSAEPTESIYAPIDQ